jgi:hypothetical protein
MTVNPVLIPHGWKYIGNMYPTRYNSGSYTSQTEAEADLENLKRTYKDEKFDVMPDTSGGSGYERWIILVKTDQESRKKKPCKTKTTRKPKKKCKCK